MADDARLRAPQSGAPQSRALQAKATEPEARPCDGPARPRPRGLSKNENLVWGAMAQADGPLKAYEILDRLKEKGVRAPMTVYRALDGLEAKGVVHKLEGLNAFLLCNHEGPHQVQTFFVCERCSRVEELEVASLETGIKSALKAAAFEMRTARLEIKGACADCAA